MSKSYSPQFRASQQVTATERSYWEFGKTRFVLLPIVTTIHITYICVIIIHKCPPVMKVRALLVGINVWNSVHTKNDLSAQIHQKSWKSFMGSNPGAILFYCISHLL